MTNQEELIKKYIRRQLNEAEKEAFDELLEHDEQFANDVKSAVKSTAVRHLQLKQGLNAAYIRRKRLRLGKYLALTTIALLIVVGLYFRENIKKYFEPKPTVVVKKEILVENNGQMPNPTTNSPTNNQSTTTSVQKPKNNNERAKMIAIFEDSIRLDAFITERSSKEKEAGASQNDWREQLFSQRQYQAALATIRQEIPVTNDSIKLNTLHLYGGILNASLPDGNRQEAITWLKAVIDYGDYADYAAEFLVKVYIELGEKEEAKKLLVQFPDVRDKLPLYLQKRL
jgi:hypothetical protein